MLLQNKNAIIYGGGGSLGGAVAKAFAAAGAVVFVTGISIQSVQKTVDAITASGGKAQANVVDALNELAVKNHIEIVVAQAGSVDIVFNAIGLQDTQNIPLTEMALDDFVRPIDIAMRTQFITCTAAGRVMKQQNSGVILSLTATPGGIGYPNVGGFGPACSAIESFSRDLASELGIYSVRVVNIRSGGSPDSRPFMEALEQDKEMAEYFLKKLANDTMLKKMPLMKYIADTAVFLASDMAGAITGVTIDVTSGTTTGLNYDTVVIPFKQDR